MADPTKTRRLALLGVAIGILIVLGIFVLIGVIKGDETDEIDPQNNSAPSLVR